MINVDIVCPLYNAASYLDSLLAGIYKQHNINIVNFIFPVTESNDNTLDIVKNIPNSIVLEVKRNDFSHSLTREMAINYATCDVVIFLTQDVILENEMALFELSNCINENIIQAFSKQTTKSKGIEKYIRKKNYPQNSYVVEKKDIEKMQIKAFYSSDACAAYNRKKFLELNGFDGKKLPVSEDMYFSRKALLNGYSIKYCAESIIVHSHNFTLKQLYKRYFDIGLFFGQNPEFCEYKSNSSGFSLALYVFKEAIKCFDLVVLFRLIPDMLTRLIAKKKGERYGRKKYNSSK